jgi:hypothetical protein
LRIIIDRMKLPIIFLIIYINFYFLYEYLVKLGTTTEKRFIIDIINLKELYKNREIINIRWINNTNNSTDIIIKILLNKTLEIFISINKLTIRIEE